MPTTAQTPQAGPAAQRSRPDPSFVAQLIATAERLPQTRLQRRGAAAEALNAYAMPQRRPQQAGLRTRQIA